MGIVEKFWSYGSFVEVRTLHLYTHFARNKIDHYAGKMRKKIKENNISYPEQCRSQGVSLALLILSGFLPNQLQFDAGLASTL